MKVAVMQPYFFPFLGYFELIKKCDIFIFFDDVQYIRRGFINRNTILSKSGEVGIIMPVKKGDRSLNINEIFLSDTFEDDYNKFRKQCEYAYGKSDNYFKVKELIEKTYNAFKNSKKKDIGVLAQLSIIYSAEILELKCKFMNSSDFPNPKNLKKDDRIIDICLSLKEIDTYINRPGGKDLYDKKKFQENGIKLEFTNDLNIYHNYSIIHEIANEGILRSL